MKKTILLITLPALLLLNSCGGIDFQESGGIAFESSSQVIVSNRGLTSNISQIDAQRIAQSRCQTYGKDAKYEGYTEARYVFKCIKPE